MVGVLLHYVFRDCAFPAAVPRGYASSIDVAQVKKVFPYGHCDLQIVEVQYA